MAINVMIVEDDLQVLEVNSKFLETLTDFKLIAQAKNGEEAIENIRKLKPDVVLLDFYLPDRNGLDVIQIVRKENFDVDFILLTAARDVETIQDVFRYGAIDYIIKPFRFTRLKDALMRYKDMWEKLNYTHELSQADIDKNFSFQSIKGEEKELPKGLNQITLKQILLYLMNSRQKLSAEEVANGTGLARVTVRRYLDYLVQTNRIKLEIQYGTVGRPIHLYYI